MGELARLKAVTERVPCSNHRIFPNLPLPAPSQARRWLASSPKGGAKGGCAAEYALSYPLGRAGAARPLALPMGELARRSRD